MEGSYDLYTLKKNGTKTVITTFKATLLKKSAESFNNTIALSFVNHLESSYVHIIL